MKDEHRTEEDFGGLSRAELISELAELRQRVAELKVADTERQRAEERIQHLNLVLRAIRSVNQLITREKDRDCLLQGACESLIETRGYHSAWIALLDESGGLVTTAEAGLGEAFLSLAERLKRGELTACGRRALSQSGVVITEDPASVCADCPLSKNYGGRGAMTVRLEHGGKVYGLLSVSIPRDLVASEEEQALFKEVGRDIAFALHDIALEEERGRAEEARREERDRAQTYLDVAGVMFVVIDADQNVSLINRQGCEILGREEEEIVGKNWFDTCIPERLRDAVKAVFDRLMDGEIEPVEYYENPVVTKGGEERIIAWHNTLLTDDIGNTIGTLSSGEDITERRRAEEALRVSEERFALAVRGSNDGLWDWDIQNNSLYWSPRLKELLGYADDELDVDFDTFESLLHPDDREHTGAAIEAHLKDRGLYEVEQRLRTKSGEYRWFRARGQALWDEAGNPLRMVGSTTDITERKRAEEALRESEERYRSVYDTAPLAFVVWDRDCRVTDWNKRAEALFGWSAEEVLGRNFFEFLIPEGARPQVEVVVEALLRGELPSHSINENLTKSGEIIVCEWNNAVLRDGEGQVAGAISLALDITDRVRAEEALRRSEYLLRQVLDTSPAVIFVKDYDSRVLLANKAMAGFYNLSVAEVTGRLQSDLHRQYGADPKEVDQWLADDREVIDTGRPKHLVESGTDSQNRQLWFRTAKYPIDIGQGRHGVLVISEDITERVRAEEALQEYSEHLEEMVEERTRELREAQEQLVRREKLAVLGQLAGGVGHELRNPLGVISNAVYFLQMTLPDADETTKEYLEIIAEEVRNSTKIVSDLLDFSRTRMPEREEIAVSELVAQVLEKHPSPEGVEVTTEIAPDLPPVLVDPRQMGQVLANLVTNAYQAMPEGGALTISAQTSEVSEKLPKSEVALSVADTGSGISDENMAKLFEPLFTTRARGIGLGLAVSKTLVEANGGSIEVESEVDVGSTFTVRLPLAGGLR